MHKPAIFFLAVSAVAQAPSSRAVGTMSQLMIDVIYPTSNAIFYIERTPPKTDVDWEGIRTNALTLAESANLLSRPGRTRDTTVWEKDASLLADAGASAYKAALAKDAKALAAAAESIDASCTACHRQYRTDLFLRPAGAK